MDEREEIPRAVDVLIAGGGPAGAATALALARAGATAVVVERSRYMDVRLGETVPPRIREPLAELGVASDFLDRDHLPSFANASSWGGPDLTYQDFLFNPWGNGWHLARGAFDRELAREAAEVGATVLLDARLARFERGPDGWQTEVHRGGRSLPLRAELLVDATGRGSGIARRIGHQQIQEDRLIGLAGHLDEEGSATENALLLEAAAEGWWYSAPLPGRRRVAVYMTDADLLPRSSRGLAAFWSERLRGCEHIRRRLSPAGTTSRLTARPAHSFILDHVTGPGFLAVGDAACGLDPLSSGGIHKALRSGLDAARAAIAHLGGDASALPAYEAAVRAEYGRYLERRAEHYALETRWPGSPFWRRRSSAFRTGISSQESRTRATTLSGLKPSSSAPMAQTETPGADA